ncbi:hypothetical protein RB195_026318 [Necator americanus]|uniref:Uncharacterized protein n=1 Tax=Necator americanus TaxID=51031 RepID=A0ABR1EWK4_NECAM
MALIVGQPNKLMCLLFNQKGINRTLFTFFSTHMSQNILYDEADTSVTIIQPSNSSTSPLIREFGSEKER